jgi:hypothetical protein
MLYLICKVKSSLEQATNEAEWFPCHMSMDSESGNAPPPLQTQYENQEKKHNHKYTKPKGTQNSKTRHYRYNVMVSIPSCSISYINTHYSI